MPRAFLGFVLFVLSAPDLSGQERPPIIDMHMHARTSAARGADGMPAPVPCFPLGGCELRPTIVRTDEDVMRLALEAMDRNNIVLGVVTDADLERVYQWADARPGRFLAGAAVFNVARADTAALRAEFEAGRLQVMGELGTQYQGLASNDPENEPLFALADDLGVPVLVHAEGIAGGTGIRPFRIADGHPEHLQDVVAKYPDLRVWMENAGYPFVDEAIALMYRYPNVYADLSTITWVIPRAEFYRYLERLMDAGLGKRLMWGSDQMSWPSTIDHSLDAIREAPFLSEDQKRDLLYNNAVEFLRLDRRPVG